MKECAVMYIRADGRTDGWMDWMNDRKGARALEQVTRLLEEDRPLDKCLLNDRHVCTAVFVCMCQNKFNSGV